MKQINSTECMYKLIIITCPFMDGLICLLYQLYNIHEMWGVDD